MEDTQDSDFRVLGDVLWKYSLARLFTQLLDYSLLGKQWFSHLRLLSESHRISGDRPYTEKRFA